MANKISVIPLLDSNSDSNGEGIGSLAARCVASFGSSRRGKVWYESIEWNVIASSETFGPNVRFEPLEGFETFKKQIEKEQDELLSKGKVQEVKKMVMTALSLPWNDDGLFSPVKRNTAGGTHRPARSPLKLILLLGSAPVQSPTVIITPQIRKMLDSMEIQIIHVAEKTHFTSIHFINSNVPLTTRLFDPLLWSLRQLVIEPAPHTTPEGLTDGIVRFGSVDYNLKVHAREKIDLIEMKAELGSNVLIQLLPFLSAESSTVGVFEASTPFPPQAVGKLFFATVNRSLPSLLSVKQIGSRISISLRSVNQKVILGDDRLASTDPKSGSVLHEAFQPSQSARQSFNPLKKISDQTKLGCGFLRDQLDQIGRLSRKNGIHHGNILPTKLRVRMTPTKTPMKENLLTPRRTPQTPKQAPSTPSNDHRELKRLSRMVPDGVTGLADSIRAALKYSSFVTIVRVVDNFIRKHKTETLKSLRSTKVQIVQKFGGTDQLAREIKTQLILYLSEGDSFDQEEFTELCLLMRWFSFISSSVEMNSFFEEEVIPIWLEADSTLSIHRFISVYDELFLNVPKLLSSYCARGDDESSGDEEEDDGSVNTDVVTLGPSSVTNSIPSSMFSMFSIGSNRDESQAKRPQPPEASRRITSNAQRRISVGVTQRRQSEPVKSLNGRSHSSSSNLSNRQHQQNQQHYRNQQQYVGKKPDRAKRALFSSPDRSQPEAASNMRRTKTLRTHVVKDTPSKNQTLTKSQRMKDRVKRRRTESKSGISVINESPERKTKFTAANPEITFNTDHYAPSKTLQKVISVDESFNRSSVDLFSPPKNPDSLLFGSGSSSEDELVSRSSQLAAGSSSKFISRSVSLVIESPIKVDENRENVETKRSVRRSLMSHFGSRNSPRFKNVTPTSSGQSSQLAQPPLSQKDSNSITDVFNDSFEALEKGTILTPKHERTVKSSGGRVRRQLKLSESED